MPNMRPDPNIDNLIKKYLAGKSLYKIAKESGVSRAWLTPRFKARNIPIRGVADAAPIRHRSKADVVMRRWDEVVGRYLDGESAPSIAKDIGVNKDTLVRVLAEQGIQVRNRSQEAKLRCRRKPFCQQFPRRFKLLLYADVIVDSYQSGESALSLSVIWGCTSNAMLEFLQSLGVDTRNISESNQVHWQSHNAEERLSRTKQLRNYHADPSQKIAAMERAAVTRQRSLSSVYSHETRVAAMLRCNEIPVTPQKAVGTYNVDIALYGEPIGIEIFSMGAAAFNESAPKSGATPQAKRCEELLSRGWFLIWLLGERVAFDWDFCDKQLLAFMDLASRDKSVLGKYAVIHGTGHAPPRARYDFGDLTRVESPLPFAD